eukprot:TRINITY_DN66967_c8_g5_i1.p1 TRINITY_DN66967_c8_g5~~TRINITY_DN66967_c8_g5_i1.p1  ORF type:complete len:169 (+),score=96.09 TRINITY_DN66967_c8_g5_i1:39-545(+)
MSEESQVSFDDEQQALVKAIFDIIDDDENGQLDYDEVFHLLKHMALSNGMSADIAALDHACKVTFAAMAGDGKDTIGLEQFESFIWKQVQGEEDITQSLRKIQQEYKGAVAEPPPPPEEDADDEDDDEEPPSPPAQLVLNLDADGDEDDDEDDDDAVPPPPAPEKTDE